MNAGKQFEKDFEASCKDYAYTRLNDPASSFNLECNNCPKKKTRFAPKHLCDMVLYSYPNIYFIELKSTKQKSIPFKNIKKNEKDKRLDKMCSQASHVGVRAYIVFNFRGHDNLTYAVNAQDVFNYILTSSRKSIPLEWIKEEGRLIQCALKRIHYKYEVSFLIV